MDLGARTLTFSDAVRKGRARLLQLSGATYVEQTVWENIVQLQENGWDVYSPSLEFDPFPQDLVPAFQALRLPTRVPIEHAEHDFSGRYRSLEFDATGGRYWNRIDPYNGVIISVDNHSPQRTADEAAILGERRPRLPPLHNFSDIVGLQFMRQMDHNSLTTGDVRLKFWFRHDVSSGDTHKIMNDILQIRGIHDPGPWPGVTYPVFEEHGLALLGTPCGAGVVWFITQHRALLFGNELLYVEGIRLFTTRVTAPPGAHYFGLANQTRTALNLCFVISRDEPVDEQR